MGILLDMEFKDCFFGRTVQFVTTILIITQLMLFVGILDTTAIQPGHSETDGASKAVTAFIWSMLNAVQMESGVLVLI